MSLKQQSISGVIWTFADALFIKGVFFGATIFLARLLGPEEFGLIGMISIFIAVGTTLVDSGLSSSLIRSADLQEVDYSSVFYMNVIISIMVYTFIFYAAPYIASFYKQVVLTEIIRVYCITFIISAFTSVHIARLVKQMQFKRLLLLNIPGTVVGVFASIILSYNGYGVWSIVSLYIAMQMIQAIMLWLFAGWKPKLIFSLDRALYHYRYGYKLMIAGLLNTIFDNIYNVVVGKYYSPKSLGYFERAKTFNEYPVIILTNVINKVSFPMLSKLQDQSEKVSIVYRQIMKLSFFIIAPLMIGMAAIAKPLFTLILGPEWLSAVLFFQILCISGIFYPIHSFNINVLKVYGRSDLFLKLEIIKKIVVVLCILSLFSFGLLGIVWSNVAASFIALIINAFYSGKMMNYPPSDQFRDMLPILIFVAIMFLIMYYMLYCLQSYPIFFQIIIPGTLGMIFYFAINYIFKSATLSFAISLIKK